MESSKNLSELFDSGFELFNDLNKNDEAVNKPTTQSTIKKLISIFEEATKLVSFADIFSSNENFDEVSTENIKYFLLPALLGTLTIKISATEDRAHLVEVAEIYFIDFLKRLKSYELIDVEIPEIKQKIENTVVTRKSNAELISEMVNIRSSKIKRYQEQKELEKKLDILQKNLESPNIDDESKREYFVTLIKTFANKAIDELSLLSAEKPILEHMKTIDSNPKETPCTHAKLKPIIITRDVMQKKVYGAGYPSLPILTVQEFYDHQIKTGEWTDCTKKNSIDKYSLKDFSSEKTDEIAKKDKEDEELEIKVEKDDIVNLSKQRTMDEYKDSHRRGWGNRANRS